MPTMCANVAKGWLTHAIESALSNNPDYDDILSKLRDKSRPLNNILFDIGILTTGYKPHDEMKAHLDKHWYNDGADAYWPHRPAKEEVVRHGYIKCVELAQTHKLPVCILWICAGHHFQCAVTKSDAQIMLLVLTPHTPNAVPQLASTEPEDLWIIGPTVDIEEIVREAVNYNGRPTQNDCVLLDKDSGVWEAPIFTDPTPPPSP